VIRDEETSLSGAALQEIKSAMSLEEWEEKDTLLRFCKRQTENKKDPRENLLQRFKNFLLVDRLNYKRRTKYVAISIIPGIYPKAG